MGKTKSFILRFILWVLTKFYRNHSRGAMGALGYPAFGKDKYGLTFLILSHNTVDDKDVFENANDEINNTVTMLEEQKEDAKVLKFRSIKGGTMHPHLKNHTETPLVSIILVSHSGDIHLLPRALQSILNQEIPLKDMELLIYFDGYPTPEENSIFDAIEENEAFSYFWNCQIIYGEKKNGYYTVGRNRVTPLANGFYIYNMDADNEILPGHLNGLLEEIRKPGPDGFPHFTYSRRKYVVDPGVENPPTRNNLESTLKEWNVANLSRLCENPQGNFVDTGDMLISKSALYRLSDVTGFIWNSEIRRFGDWDLVRRMALTGMRGSPVDAATNIYHWTGKNLQVTRDASGQNLVVMPESIYNDMQDKGLVKKEKV